MWQTIFSLSSLIILLLLVVINLLWLNFSKRKRRFGLIPSYLLCIAYIAFLGGVGYVLAYVKQDKRRFQDEVVIDKSFGNEKYQTEMKRKLSLQKYEDKYSTINLYMQYSLRCCTMQSLLGLLLSVYGILSIYNRNAFYYRMMVLHFTSLILCLLTEANMIG